MIDREREAETQEEGEAGPCWEPDVGLDPGTPGSHPGPKAGPKLPSHPGIPKWPYFFHMAVSVFFLFCLTQTCLFGGNALCLQKTLPGLFSWFKKVPTKEQVFPPFAILQTQVTIIKNIHDMGIPGWLSGLGPAFGPGCDPGVPGSGPESGFLHGACLCLCLCLSLSVSLMNK